MDKVSSTRKKIIDMVYISLFAVLIAVCSWISIPTLVPFTLQTFGVFCAAGLLGGKRGTMSVIVYLLLGAVGLPVFASFKGGIASLLGVTGGYIVGFVFTAAAYWIITGLFGKSTLTMIIGMLSGLVLCYAFGTAWFMYAYAKSTGSIGVASALSMCVFPFIIPDIIKIVLAAVISKIIPKHVKIFD